MPGLKLAASRKKHKKSAPEEWLGSAQPEEAFDEETEPDPLFDMPPSAAPVRVHATTPAEDSTEVAKMMAMMQQQQDLIESLQGQVSANTSGRLQQTPQGTLAVTPYQVSSHVSLIRPNDKLTGFSLFFATDTLWW